MTAIVGIIQDGEVWIGGDGVTAFGYYVMPSRQPKVFRVGEALVGVSGSPRVGQLLRLAVETAPCPPDADPYKWLCLDFSTALRTVVNEHGAMKTEEGADDIKSHALIGIRGRLFYMDGLFAIYESSRGYEACGGGSEVVMGSLITSHHMVGVTPEQRIRWALEACFEVMPSIGPPYTIDHLPVEKVPEVS